MALSCLAILINEELATVLSSILFGLADRPNPEIHKKLVVVFRSMLKMGDVCSLLALDFECYLGVDRQAPSCS